MTRIRPEPPLVPPDFVRGSLEQELPPELMQPLDLLFAIRRCHQRINATLVRWLGEDALSPGRLQALQILRAHDGPMRQRALVEALSVSRASVSELVDGLERDNLVMTRADPADRRGVLVALTPDGEEVARRKLVDNARELQRTFSALTPTQQSTLMTLLERLCAG